MTPPDFAEASAVTPLGEGSYSVEVPAGWDVLGATNGGLLLATTARALMAETGRVPVTLTAHYLAPVAPGRATIATDLVKRGRGFTTATARLSQQERDCMAVLGSFGTIEADPQVLLQDAEPVVLPAAPGQMDRVRADAEVGLPPPLMDRVDIRLHPQDAGFMAGQASGQARMRAWVSPGAAWDPPGVILACDVLPPTIFNANLPVNWTPTLELTVHVRSIPGTEYVRVDSRTRFVSHGRLEVDSLVWDERGDLVAQSRQLMLVPRPAS